LTERERAQAGRAAGKGRSRLLAEQREPNVELDPRTLGSGPEPKAAV